MFSYESVRRMKVKFRMFAFALATSMVFLGATQASADQIYLQIEGVQGESNDKDFRDAVEVLGWSWGLTRQPSSGGQKRPGATRAGAAVTVQDLNFTHFLDRATPKLMEYCATGNRIPNMRLSVRKQGGVEQSVSYLIIDLTNVLVSNIATSGAASSSSSRPTVDVSLTFETVQVSYTPIGPTGQGQGPIPFGWDVVRNELN